MNPSSVPGFIGQKVWADRIGVSVRTFRRWREAGLIPLPDCVAPGNPRWSMELVNRTTLRRRKAPLQSLPSRRVQRDRSLKGADVSAKDVGVRHDTESNEAGLGSPLNTLENGAAAR